MAESYPVWRGPAGNGITPEQQDDVDAAIAAAADLAVALPQVEQARQEAVASAQTAATDASATSVDRGAAEAARIAAEQAATSAAQSAQFYDTIAAGRAAVADGAQFGVRAGGTDGLARPTIYRRDSATTQTLIVEIIVAGEIDSKASRAEVGQKLDAAGAGSEPTSDEAWSVGDRSGHIALSVESDGTTRGVRFRVADETGQTISALGEDGLETPRVGVAGVVELTEDGVVTPAISVDVSSRMLSSDDNYWVWRIDDGDGNVGAGLGADGVFRVKEIASTVPIGGGTAPVEPEPTVVINARDAAIICAAHRGYSGPAPEETLPAYLAAVRAGYRVLEGDIQFTADMVPVLIHDSTVDRTSNGTGTVAEMTYDQLLALDFGSWKGAAFAGTRIMRVVDMLLFCKRHNCKALLELKNYTWTQERVQTILDLIRSVGMTGRTQLDSFQTTAVQWVRDFEPTMDVGLLIGGTITSSNIATAAALKTGSNAVYLQGAHAAITQALIEQAHMSGVKVGAYTVDTAARALELIDAGIDLLFTNTLNVQALINSREDV